MDVDIADQKRIVKVYGWDSALLSATRK